MNCKRKAASIRRLHCVIIVLIIGGIGGAGCGNREKTAIVPTSRSPKIAYRVVSYSEIIKRGMLAKSGSLLSETSNVPVLTTEDERSLAVLSINEFTEILTGGLNSMGNDRWKFVGAVGEGVGKNFIFERDAGNR